MPVAAHGGQGADELQFHAAAMGMLARHIHLAGELASEVAVEPIAAE